ncbi:MAG TPA: tetratricopeptide repeat protein [Caulobacteraceae bacterium]|jgi:predicted O-linked N-acetylglucosamine transferase (SPINDLY family)|nr:tetratricopeptide repeat protein [Caulobacteraceae bacterium]
MDPRFAAAEAALKASRIDEAADLLTAALQEGPGPAGAYRIVATRLFNLRQFAEAEHWVRAGLERFPKELDLWNLLGVILRRQGRLEEAIVALDKAHKLNPKNLMPMINQANVLNDLKQSARALAIGQKLVRLQPANAEHHRILGIAYRDLDQFDNAAARFDVAARLQPKLIDAWLDRAGIAIKLQQHDEAVEIFERALKVNPDDIRLLESYVIALRRTGRRDDAEAFLRDRFAAGKDEAWAHIQLGRTLADFDRQQADVHFRRAVELDPSNMNTRLVLAESLDRARYGDEGANIQEAVETLRSAMALGELKPSDMHVARQIAIRVGDYDLLASLSTFEAYGRGLAKAGLHGPMLQQLGRVETPEDRFEVLKQHRMWGELIESAVARNPIRRPPPRPKDGRIRVGFMSSDLRSHPVAYFAFPLFQHIDPSRFDVYCYSFYTGAEDATQRYITSKVTAFRWHKSMSARAAAQMIADDQLDILFELGGSTHMNKLETMAYKPAPLQASYLGYPHSAGLEAIDYLVVDPYIKPPNPALLLEKPMIMPKSWISLGQANFRDDQAINPITPEERNGMITFGTANNPHKYGPLMLRTWAKVVAATPNSRFLFVRPEGGTPAFRENMTRLFVEEGVAPERVQFQAVRGAHLPFYNEIDIALDTFPLTGGTTTCETLWMGVPVVSLLGEAFFERLSYSILTNVGLGDLVSSTLEGYVETAVKLAADPARRMLLRSTLRDQIKASPLGQHQQFARDFYDVVAATVAAA